MAEWFRRQSARLLTQVRFLSLPLVDVSYGAGSVLPVRSRGDLPEPAAVSDAVRAAAGVGRAAGGAGGLAGGGAGGLGVNNVNTCLRTAACRKM